VGHSIVATWEPHQALVFELVHALGLEHQVVFNKGAVMVLPPGVNKQTGLVAALERLELSPHECVGIGDAENDHAFLLACECAVAVANALPAVQQHADWVTPSEDGAGVAELAHALVADDLRFLDARLGRHDVVFAGGRSSRVQASGPSASARLTRFGMASIPKMNSTPCPVHPSRNRV
jgi:phosphoserine phosphatase